LREPTRQQQSVGSAKRTGYRRRGHLQRDKEWICSLKRRLTSR
jgi:hypothetical protein